METSDFTLANVERPKKIRLRSKFGSSEFLREYDAAVSALNGHESPAKRLSLQAKSVSNPGTFRWLTDVYLSPMTSRL